MFIFICKARLKLLELFPISGGNTIFYDFYVVKAA